MIVGLAGIVQQPLLIVASPLLVGLFLLAPPVGIYRHDEIPKELTHVHLGAVPIENVGGASAAFRIVLVNDGAVVAENFRIRLLVPVSIVPAAASDRLLGQLHVGSLGTHWFTETAYSATAITFRAGRAEDAGSVVCEPRTRTDLLDLLLPAQRAPFNLRLDYQVNGGNVSATLAQVALGST